MAQRIDRRHPALLPLMALGAVMTAAFVVVMHAGRDTTFFFDDWNFVEQRIAWTPHNLLFPHNEHLSLVPVVIYKLLFETVGLDSYGAFRAVNAGLDLAIGALVFVYARRRLGDWIAVGIAATVMLMGPAAYDLVWPFQIGFMGSVAAGLGALVCLDRRTRGGDIAACALATAAVASSSVGLPVLAGVALDVVLRRDRLRRLWVFGVPALLYGLWYLKYGVASADLANATKIPDNVFTGLSASTAAVTGLPGFYGRTLALVLIGAVIGAAIRPQASKARLAAVVAIPLVFWALAALARSDLPPDTPRYLYPTAVFVGLIGAEAFGVFRVHPRAALVVTAVLGLGALGAAPAIDDFGDSWRGFARTTRAALTAAEILGPRVVEEMQRPDPTQPQLHYGPYRAAVEAYGSDVAWSEAELARRPLADRLAVDAALVRLAPRATRAAGAGDRPAACAAHDAEAATPFGGRGLYVEAGEAPVEIRLGRFAPPTDDVPPVTVVEPGRSLLLGLPSDRSETAWTAATRSSARYRACAPT